MKEAFAMGSPTAGGGGPESILVSLIPILAMFAIFYFLLIRPQMKKQKEHAGLLASLKENDNVLTSGGIYGTIVKIKGDVLTLQVADNVRLKVARANVSSLKLKEDK